MLVYLYTAKRKMALYFESHLLSKLKVNQIFFGEICKHQDRHEVHYLKHFPPKLPQNSNFQREVDWCIHNISMITLGTRQKPEKNMTLCERGTCLIKIYSSLTIFGKKMKIDVTIIVIKIFIICCQWWVLNIFYAIIMFWKIDVNVMNMPIIWKSFENKSIVSNPF